MKEQKAPGAKTILRWIVLTTALMCAPSLARGADLEDLARDGYAVIEETSVDGEFEGCDFDKRIPLSNGLVFVCSEYSYSYGYMPEVLILKHVKSGDLKVLIDGDEYHGTLYRM